MDGREALQDRMLLSVSVPGNDRDCSVSLSADIRLTAVSEADQDFILKLLGRVTDLAKVCTGPWWNEQPS